MDKVEIFTVYLKEDGQVSIEINEDVLDAYGVSVYEFSRRFDNTNLHKGIEDFGKALGVK